MKISLAISHTPWKPERAEAFKKLDAALGVWDGPARIEDKPGHFSEWSLRMWGWAVGKDVEWCLFLQDDTVVAPNFRERLEAILGDAPTSFVGLHVMHPAARSIYDEGFDWFTSDDCLVGVGYAIRREALVEFVTWRQRCAHEAAKEIPEDTLLALWIRLQNASISHPLPALVDHDVSLASTFGERGNDTHAHRSSAVRWDAPQRQRHPLEAPWWWDSGKLPHVGSLWGTQEKLAERFDLGKPPPRPDTGFLRRLRHAQAARAAISPVRLMVGTPMRGNAVHPFYAKSLTRLLNREKVELELPFDLVDAQIRPADVVKTRSRLVEHFLHKTSADFLLFLDSDIEVEPECIMGMLNSHADFVAAPYPRRSHIDFKRAAAAGPMGLPPEALAYRYALRVASGEITPDERGLAPVEGVPLGCALLSRKMLASMWERYKELEFEDEDQVTGKRSPCVALFQLIIESDGARGLLSEDFSFCVRAAELGFKPHLYLGEGSPVIHHGDWAYAGVVESFGLRRVKS